MHRSHEVWMLRVDGLKRRGHVELDLDAVAFLPRAFDARELARLRRIADSFAVHGDGCLRPCPRRDAQIDRKRRRRGLL